MDGCKNLTSLTDIFSVTSTFDALKYRDVVRDLTVTNATLLRHCDVVGFRFLRRLTLRRNAIEAIEFSNVLTNLETLDLSENPLTRFVASDVIGVTPNLKTLILSNCSDLEQILLANSNFPTDKPPELLVSLESLVLDDNPRLVFICPWFLRSAPNLLRVSINRCPKLDIDPGVFVDSRFFPALKDIELSETSLTCDCSLLPQNKSNLNPDLVQKFRDDLRQQNVCRHNLTTVSVESFFNGVEACQLENEINLSDHNPTLDLSWFDPYTEVDENATSAAVEVLTDYETTEERRIPVWNTVQLDCRSDSEAESVFWVSPTNAVFLLMNRTTADDTCHPNVQILRNACGQV